MRGGTCSSCVREAYHLPSSNINSYRSVTFLSISLNFSFTLELSYHFLLKVVASTDSPATRFTVLEHLLLKGV